MGETRSRPLTFDAGALIALERGSGRMRALMRLIAAAPAAIHIPAGALAQAWRGSDRQAVLAALLKREHVSVPALNEATAKAAGILCGRAGTSDVVDASVVLCARLTHSVVVTTDPNDIRRLDPQLPLEVV